MKSITKLLYLLLVAVFCNVNSFAGGDDKIGGIRAGYHSANQFIDGDKIGGFDPLNSFYVGFYKTNRIVPILNWEFGAEYFKNGAISGNNKYELHYLSVPLDLKVKLGPVFVLGGLAPSFKVAEKWDLNGTKYDPTGDEKSEWFDAPVLVGVGFEILMFKIEARYHWGLMELSDDGTKNQYLQIGAGVSF